MCSERKVPSYTANRLKRCFPLTFKMHRTSGKSTLMFYGNCHNQVKLHSGALGKALSCCLFIGNTETEKGGLPLSLEPFYSAARRTGGRSPRQGLAAEMHKCCKTHYWLAYPAAGFQAALGGRTQLGTQAAGAQGPRSSFLPVTLFLRKLSTLPDSQIRRVWSEF